MQFSILDSLEANKLYDNKLNKKKKKKEKSNIVPQKIKDQSKKKDSPLPTTLNQ